MSENAVEITCPRCKHTWPQDLDDLDEKDLVVYRGETQTKRYRVRCPRCRTRHVATVADEGDEHG